MARDAASARIRAAKLTQVLNRIIQRTELAEGVIHVAVHDGVLGSPTVDHIKGIDQPVDKPALAQAPRLLPFGEFQTCLKHQVAALLDDSHLRFGGFHVIISGGKVGRYKVVFGLLPDEVEDLARTLYASLPPSGEEETNSNEEQPL